MLKARGTAATQRAYKAAETRVSILEAAIQCYMDVGYSRTTLQRVSSLSGLTRGAVLYHFSSMANVTEAAVFHLQRKRLALYRDAVERFSQNGKSLDAAIDMLWEQISHPLFTANHELTVAARSDPEIEKWLRQGQEEAEREWAGFVRSHCDASAVQNGSFILIADLAYYLMVGIAASFMWTNAEYRRRRLLETLKAHVRSIIHAHTGDGTHTVTASKPTRTMSNNRG